MATIVLDLLNSAYRLAGMMSAPGRGLSTEEKAEGVSVFNDILDQWNAQRLSILSIPRILFSLVPGQHTYEIGPAAADWVVPNRPPKIENAGFIILNNVQQPLELPINIMTTDQWAYTVPIKIGITSAICTAMWYDVQFPIGYVHMWPTPSVNAQIALYLWTQLAAAVDQNTVLSLAPGYKQALQYALAVEIRRRFARPPDGALQGTADRAFGILKAVNIPAMDMAVDAALIKAGSWNWYTGSTGPRGAGG